jgi:FkbM family methyltransferase
MTYNFFHGEYDTDRFIRENFYPDYDFKGVMLELGAGDPENCSLSKHFRENGWRCVCIDPNPYFIEKHNALGHEIYPYACSSESSNTKFYIFADKEDSMSHSSLGMRYGAGKESLVEIDVEVITLDSLMQKLNINSIDLACIDVEGWEIEVLDGFDLDKYKPHVILLENYTSNPDYGKYMTSKNYTFHTRLYHNEIYVRNTECN